MELIESLTLQPLEQDSLAEMPDLRLTNPTSLTLALIAIGTFLLLGRDRRMLRRFRRQPIVSPGSRPQAPWRERKAA